MTLDKVAVRVGTAAALGLGIGFGIFQLQIGGFDGDAYWQAALRLREGQPLYVEGSIADPTVYRYPAWFAWLWVPLSYLPHDAVMAVWRVVLLGAVLSIVPPLWRHPLGRIGLALFAPMLLATAWMGNVQPLVVALAVYGGAWIGVAAGLKGIPIVALAPYVLRREWRTVTVAVVIAAGLWATTLLYDLSGYPTVRGFWPTDLAIALALIPSRSPIRSAVRSPLRSDSPRSIPSPSR